MGLENLLIEKLFAIPVIVKYALLGISKGIFTGIPIFVLVKKSED